MNDWPDREAIAILARCAEATRPGGRVVAGAVPGDSGGSESALPSRARGQAVLALPVLFNPMPELRRHAYATEKKNLSELLPMVFGGGAGPSRKRLREKRRDRQSRNYRRREACSFVARADRHLDA